MPTEDSSEWVSVEAKPKPSRGGAQKQGKPQQQVGQVRKTPPKVGKDEKKANKQGGKPKQTTKKQKQGNDKNGSGNTSQKMAKPKNPPQRSNPLQSSDFPALGASDFPSLATHNSATKKQQPTWTPKSSLQNPAPSHQSVEQQSSGVPRANRESKPPQNQPKQKNKKQANLSNQNPVDKKYANPQLRQADFPSLSANDFPSLSAAPVKPKPPKPTFAKKPSAPPPTKKKAPKKPTSKPKSPRQTIKAEPSKLSATQMASFLAPAGPPRLEGGEHDLLRLMQEGKMVIQNKGRQRIRPRKKKFSSLKKKVLEERLRRWKELNPSEPPGDAMPTRISTVCLKGYVNSEELEDDDEYEEITDNLREMAVKVGEVKRIFIPRPCETDEVPAFVDFVQSSSAGAAIECWGGLVLGGAELHAEVVTNDSEAPEDDEAWQQWCVMPKKEDSAESMDADDLVLEISLENALTEDDLEDEECMEESIEDIRVLAGEFGHLEFHRVEEGPVPFVILGYKCSIEVAKEIAAKLSKKVMGGTLLSAKLLYGDDIASKTSSDHTIILSNALTDDDVEDEECLEESLNDLRELAVQFGIVNKIEADTKGKTVQLSFLSADEAKRALEAFEGMVIGGEKVSAVLPSNDVDMTDSIEVYDADTKEDKNKPMFSGDKVISERFAECKRAPKIPNSGQPRTYAVISEDETVKPLLSGMLAELMRLQRRAVEDKNAKARRRLVMGLREVARGLRSRKVRMVVMANNLDDYGVLDEKMQEILDLAIKEDVPVFFEFSKRALGKAVGKTIKLAVVGIQNCDGANQQFKKLSLLAPKLLVPSR